MAQNVREQRYSPVTLTNSGGSTVSTVPQALREDHHDDPEIPTELGTEVVWTVREIDGERELVVKPKE